MINLQEPISLSFIFGTIGIIISSSLILTYLIIQKGKKNGNTI